MKIRGGAAVFLQALNKRYLGVWLRVFHKIQNAKNVFSPKSMSHLSSAFSTVIYLLTTTCQVGSSRNVRAIILYINLVYAGEVSISHYLSLLLPPNDARENKTGLLVAEMYGYTETASG